jgi:hypothetical protein
MIKLRHGQSVLRLHTHYWDDEVQVEEGRVTFGNRYHDTVVDAGGPTVPVEFHNEIPHMPREEIVLNTPANMAAMRTLAAEHNERLTSGRRAARERALARVRALSHKRVS